METVEFNGCRQDKQEKKVGDKKMNLDYGETPFEELDSNIQTNLLPFKKYYEEYRKTLEFLNSESIPPEKLIESISETEFPNDIIFEFEDWGESKSVKKCYNKDDAIATIFEQSQLFDKDVYHMFWNVSSMKVYIYFKKKSKL